MEAATSLIGLFALITSEVSARRINYGSSGFRLETGAQRDDVPVWRQVTPPGSVHQTYGVPLKGSAFHLDEAQKRAPENGRRRSWRRQSIRYCTETENKEACVQLDLLRKPKRSPGQSHKKTTAWNLFNYVPPARITTGRPGQSHKKTNTWILFDYVPPARTTIGRPGQSHKKKVTLHLFNYAPPARKNTGRPGQSHKKTVTWNLFNYVPPARTPTGRPGQSHKKTFTWDLFNYVQPARMTTAAPSQGGLQEALRDALWSSEARHTTKKDTPFKRYWQDALYELTTKNTTVIRKFRWAQVMASTGLRSANNPNITAELNATLQTPAEKSAEKQTEKDLLLLHRLIQLTGWSPDKKWKAYKRGLKFLNVVKSGGAWPSENAAGTLLSLPKRASTAGTKFNGKSSAKLEKGHWNGLKTLRARYEWDATEGPLYEAETGAFHSEESQQRPERHSDLKLETDMSQEEPPETGVVAKGHSGWNKWDDTDDAGTEAFESEKSLEWPDRHSELKPETDMSQDEPPGTGVAAKGYSGWDRLDEAEKPLDDAGTRTFESEESLEWPDRHPELKPESDMSQEEPPETGVVAKRHSGGNRWDYAKEPLDDAGAEALESEESLELSKRHSELKPETDMSQDERRETDVEANGDSDDRDVQSIFETKRAPVPDLGRVLPRERNEEQEEAMKYVLILKRIDEGLKQFRDTMPRWSDQQFEWDDHERETERGPVPWRLQNRNGERARSSGIKNADVSEMLRPDNRKRRVLTPSNEAVRARKMLNRGHIKHNGVTSNKPTARSLQRQCVVDASQEARYVEEGHNPQFLQHITNTQNSLGLTPVRLIVFGELVQYSNMEVGAAWDTLSLGFRLYGNGSRLTQDEMSEVVRNMSRSQLEDGGFQERLNTMIIVDLIAFNRSGSPKDWVELLTSKPPLEKASDLGMQALGCLYSCGYSVRDVWLAYDLALHELIIGKLVLLEHDGKHTAELQQLLAKKLRGMPTAQHIKRATEVMHRGNISTSTLAQGYETALKTHTTLSLALFMEDVSSFGGAIASMKELASGVANHSAEVANATDEVLEELAAAEPTDSNALAIDEIFFLRLLLITNSSVSEEPWKELLVAKWAIRAGGSASLADGSFSSVTADVVKAFLNQGLSNLSETLDGQLSGATPTTNSSDITVDEERQHIPHRTNSATGTRTTVDRSTASSQTTRSEQDRSTGYSQSTSSVQTELGSAEELSASQKTTSAEEMAHTPKPLGTVMRSSQISFETNSTIN